MARLSVQMEEVQSVVFPLAALYLATGSVASLCRTLNEGLARTGESRELHPNRLHSLLSDDVGRGVNESTLELTRSGLEGVDQAVRVRGDAMLADVRKRAVAMRERGGEIEEIAATLSLPRAVIRTALFASGSFGLRPTPVKIQNGGLPDWSYQDTAVRRALDAFARRPNGRIGLVLPTGAGKTRVALRVALERLSEFPAPAKIIWVTHRKTLRRQAEKQLRKLLQAPSGLPRNAAELANRITFMMLSQAEAYLANNGKPCLVILDEGHHAAAPSYGTLLRPEVSAPFLILTATPNRPDNLPIGIDEIAYTITYRELADRHCIIIPEFIPFACKDLDWTNEGKLNDFVDNIIDETSGRFRKVLILVTQVSEIELLYDRLTSRLLGEVDHPLRSDDVGYIHGSANSLDIEDEDFLERFSEKRRAILISAQVLLEGYDDPSIDTVILTYQTSSIIRLMQAAGRCVRYDGEKTNAFVVQVDDPGVAYRFDHRWLHQEISDFLLPRLIDRSFSAPADRVTAVTELLAQHRISDARKKEVLDMVTQLDLVEPLKLLFYGQPYFGATEDFDTRAEWDVFLETPDNRPLFMACFNGYCESGALQSDPSEFLEQVGHSFGLRRDMTRGSTWRRLIDLLGSAHCARQEIVPNRSFAIQGNRPPRKKGDPTTWLTYATVGFEPTIPAALQAFLASCHNDRAIEADYLLDPERFGGALKLPIPGAEFDEALLLEKHDFQLIEAYLRGLASNLAGVPLESRFAEFAKLTATSAPLPIPFHFINRLDAFLDNAGRQRLLAL
ncbi:DEAD/DEAH box helicase [Agrobacterium larrymoorei]|uniref:ATP-dependent helicase n=1 Tax=Agrobacterium larrymoorei TaxID=160699 RepID=A0A4D7E0W0_9HYPH|nr:DEAD/DEAH box helicase family protein [Agrobacterium larrymoorei]QCJ00895.1 ATP-dependent helicase [Agrobacterium larrymoorei]QYA10231.1 DEAD/DEAH box helicase family protein [Agrobacterium larrymoorei]